MKIRKYINSDLDLIINIWLDASIKAHDFVPPEFWHEKIEDMRNIYIPNSETWVYEDNSEIRAFMSLCDKTIAALFVKPDYQGKGIGQKLMEKAKSLMEDLDLKVYSENINAINFYKCQGFIIKKEQEDKFTGHKELLMEFNKS